MSLMPLAKYPLFQSAMVTQIMQLIKPMVEPYCHKSLLLFSQLPLHKSKPPYLPCMMMY